MAMIKHIIELLAADDWFVGDPDIDFAKGSRAIPESIRELRIQMKRRRISGN